MPQNSGRLINKTALITGGSRGIGASIARHYAKEGAVVALTYNSSRDKADEVVAEIIENGGKAKAIKFDASNPDNAEAALNEASLENFDKVLNVNVRSVYALTHLTVPHLKSGARIINLSSILGERAIFPNVGIYNSSKFAVTGLTRSWAQDLGEDNILVNAIMPGPIDTDMNPAAGNTEQADATALKRYGQPEDIANMAVFLGSDESGFITGATFNVDGGANA